MSPAPTRRYLNHLLSERNQYPERAEQIDAEAHRVFGRKVAILVVDMCGFSSLTAKYGIMAFLAMIHQMEQAAVPAVQANGGTVIKFEADNLFAVFDHPTLALDAALDIFRAFEAMNAVLPDERDIYGSIGIGYGETLVIEERDMFSSEMNIACKLGEDLAGKMEILMTQAAYAALNHERAICVPASFEISGLQIDCFRFQSLKPTQPPETVS